MTNNPNSTRIYYDTEFIEDGHTIDLISIGIVADNGDEYYAINDDHRIIRRAMERDWLRANVIPSLPIVDAHRDTDKVINLACPDPDNAPANCWYWDEEHSDYAHVKPRALIAEEVKGFICSFPDPQLWAWYGAYDHVALAQLFGRMIDLPDGIPMFTNDLKQECVRLGNPRVPEQKSGVHNALADARHNREIARFLDARAVIHDA